jgi:lipopolysaccharide/colanic/teichoic acid biosynthesis glycosyltransferase
VAIQDDAQAPRHKHNFKWRVVAEAKRRVVSALLARLGHTHAGNRQRHRPLGGRSKRAFDIVLASALLILAAPIMLMAIVLVRVAMGGPVIAAQPRIGFNGKAFSSYKFRTIARDRQGARRRRDDPRIELLAYLLHNSGLDRWPQLFNVLRGDMSFVGPRPIGSDEIEQYGSRVRWYFEARPGLTGIWRATGRNGTAARLACDRYYVSRWSLWLDLVMLVRAVAEVQAFNDPASRRAGI